MGSPAPQEQAARPPSSTQARPLLSRPPQAQARSPSSVQAARPSPAFWSVFRLPVPPPRPSAPCPASLLWPPAFTTAPLLWPARSRPDNAPTRPLPCGLRLPLLGSPGVLLASRASSGRPALAPKTSTACEQRSLRARLRRPAVPPTFKLLLSSASTPLSG
jgi:hypothetical protein